MLYILLMFFSCAALNAGNGVQYDFLNPHGFLHRQISKGDYFGARQSIKIGIGVHQVHQGMNTIERVVGSDIHESGKKELIDKLAQQNVPVTQKAIEMARISNDQFTENVLHQNRFEQNQKEQDKPFVISEKSSSLKAIGASLKAKRSYWFAKVKNVFRSVLKKK